MQELITQTIIDNILDIIIAIITIVVSYYVIPCIKNDLVPWLEDKHLYHIVKTLVQAAEKLADSGVILKADKKQYVINLLNEQGIEVTDKVDSFIESCVKELDFVIDTAKDEILEDIDIDDLK